MILEFSRKGIARLAVPYVEPSSPSAPEDRHALDDAAGPLGARCGHLGAGPCGLRAKPEEIGPVARAFPTWVEEQLSPREEQDRAVHERLVKLTLRVHYPLNPKWPAVDELRPLTYLDKPIEDAWPLIEKRQEMDGAERRRPREEVMAATILRAVHSRWQLREVLVASGTIISTWTPGARRTFRSPCRPTTGT